MNNYQDQLTQRRREALWREVLRLRSDQQRQGKRAEQVAFSATVLLWVVLAGAACGMTLAIWGAWR